MVNMKNYLTPKNPMVTIENATPLLASYKEVPPPPGGGGCSKELVNKAKLNYRRSRRTWSLSQFFFT